MAAGTIKVLFFCKANCESQGPGRTGKVWQIKSADRWRWHLWAASAETLRTSNSSLLTLNSHLYPFHNKITEINCKLSFLFLSLLIIASGLFGWFILLADSWNSLKSSFLLTSCYLGELVDDGITLGPQFGVKTWVTGLNLIRLSNETGHSVLPQSVVLVQWLQCSRLQDLPTRAVKSF